MPRSKRKFLFSWRTKNIEISTEGNRNNSNETPTRRYLSYSSISYHKFPKAIFQMHCRDFQGLATRKCKQPRAIMALETTKVFLKPYQGQLTLFSLVFGDVFGHLVFPRITQVGKVKKRITLICKIQKRLKRAMSRGYWCVRAILGSIKPLPMHKMLLLSYEGYLTNWLQFSMVYTLIDHRNDVIKCSKLKWNHESQAGQWFHCKVLNILWRHFYGLYECRP